MAYLKGKVTLPDGRVVNAQIKGRLWWDDFTPNDELTEATLEDGTEIEVDQNMDEFIYDELNRTGVVWEEDHTPKIKSYTASYFRYGQLYYENYENEQRCIDFFMYGLLEGGSGYPSEISRNGKVVKNQEEIMKAIQKIRDRE